MENSLKKSLSLFLACPAFMMAFVEEPQSTSGVTFENPDSKTQLIRAPDKAVINCKKFNVGKGETVHFIQPSPKAKALCRVTGKEASIIEGNLKADGRLFLINPQSIYFRENAKVNVHSLIASTLNIKDEDFVKGNYKFFLDRDAKDSAIVVKGQINAAQDAVFMAPQIMNQAVIKAEVGKVAFLGGELITLNFEGDNLISFAIDEPLKKGFIEQAGKVTGQEVFLKLRVADEMLRSVINVEGLELATKMQFENGKIYLVAKSSIEAPKVKVESPLVETAGDFTRVSKLEINSKKELQVLGGTIKTALGPSEASLRAGGGVLTIDGPFSYLKDVIKDKDAPKNITFSGKIIDQNAPVKSTSSLTYSADTILLSGDTNAPNSHITFNGPVIIDGDNVKISSGQSKGDIKFNSTLDADHSSRNLTISNGSLAGTVTFKEAIGSKGPFSQLSIETGKLVFSNIGDKNRPGAEKLHIKTPNVEFLGTVVHAKEQLWEVGQSQRGEVPNFYVKSGQHTTFIAREKPLIFSATTHLGLSPQTNVVFETHGGGFEFSKLSGDHHQFVTINTGHGESKLGEFKGQLGPLHVQSRSIHVGGKIDVSSIFLEAQENIFYAADSMGKTTQYELLSKGEVTLNARRGMVGTKALPIFVQSEGKLFLGAKSYAYVEGSFKHGFPYVHQKNPPPWMIYNDTEIQYVFNEEIFMEEETLMTLSPDLLHVIPYGFVDASHFTFRKASIYFTQGDSKIGDSTDEASGIELAQVED